ncbi:hypothetical protein PG985_013921 [Apiospora marii]|uniref:Uncharacterized protein n=1 Tax=Apiospora marii TaxID=335849 RepID=A0ABR1R7E1_9PEZI
MLSLVNIIAIVGLAATAGAAPNTLETRVSVMVKICTDQDLKGICMTPSIDTQTQCQTITYHGIHRTLGGYSKTEFDNNMRSINIPDHFRCRFWDSNHCNGDSTPDLYGPGNSNVPGNMRNKATSFKCYQN